jgi:N6-L-threonylcarbamoyladenine synthase
MIAWAGVERLAAGLHDALPDALYVPARARWPLDPDATPMPFAGKKA